MASVFFDKLWDIAYEREGELIVAAAELAQIYKIPSAVEAIRLARALQESGKPFFECCETIYKRQQARAIAKVKRKYRLSDHDTKLVKALIDKKMKGW